MLFRWDHRTHSAPLSKEDQFSSGMLLCPTSGSQAAEHSGRRTPLEQHENLLFCQGGAAVDGSEHPMYTPKTSPICGSGRVARSDMSEISDHVFHVFTPVHTRIPLPGVSLNIVHSHSYPVLSSLRTSVFNTSSPRELQQQFGTKGP